MKCLFYGETPVIETGAAQISKHLLKLMMELGWTVEVVGINHFGDVEYDSEEWPFRFYDAPPNNFYNLDHAKEQILKGDYDILFLTGDLNHVDDVMDFAIEAKKDRTFPIVALVVVDADFDMPYLSKFAYVDFPLVYSEFGYRTLCKQRPELRDRLQCIPLGCDTDDFYPLDAETRQRIRAQAFHTQDPETFLVTCVNRNQRRKDLGRTMYAFHLFHQKYPNSTLYMHAKQQDIGGHLPTQAHLLDIEMTGSNTEVIFAPYEYSVVKGFPRNLLNEVYNAADVCISTSQGEGWGLTTTESMSAGTPFIGPRHTTFIDILGENEERGYLAACGGPDLWMIHYSLGEEPRPLTSCTDMAAKLEHVYLHRDEAKLKARRARKWCEKHTWKHFVNEWRVVLCNVAHSLPESQDRMAVI